MDSVEGHIAHVVYGKQLGDRVLRRIAPVSGILIWAGICESAPGELVLREGVNDSPSGLRPLSLKSHSLSTPKSDTRNGKSDFDK